MDWMRQGVQPSGLEVWDGSCEHARCVSKRERPVHTAPVRAAAARQGRWRVLLAAVIGAAALLVVAVPASAGVPHCTPSVCTDPYPFDRCGSVATCNRGLYPLRRPPVLGEAPVPVVAAPTFTG